MTESDLIDLGPNKHSIQCPYCQKLTEHHSPLNAILFATPKCKHCGKEFVIALNKPRLAS
jgi:transposase-like protein